MGMAKKVNMYQENYSIKPFVDFLTFIIILRLIVMVIELASYKSVRSSLTYGRKFIEWLKKTRVYRKTKWLINEFLCWCITEIFPMVKELYHKTLSYLKNA